MFGLSVLIPIGFGLLAQVEAAKAPVESTADPAAAATADGPSLWSVFANPLNLMVIALATFWLIVILPQQRAMKAKQQALKKMLDDLKKNDRVVTSAGIHGVVVAKSPEAGTVTIRIDDASNAKLTVDRATIVRVGSETSKD